MSGNAMQPLGSVPDLRHRVRRLHWFRQSFKDEAAVLSARYGFAFQVDDRALVEAFFAWATAFEAERAGSQRDRRDFAIFAGGLMLRELLRASPAGSAAERHFKARVPPDPIVAGAVLADAILADPILADPVARICEFWPDGYLYTNYCLTLVRAILAQDFENHTTANPQFQDLRVWQSFRENFAENPSLAVAFFDVFMGQEPNWNFPECFLSRPHVQRRAVLAAEPPARL